MRCEGMVALVTGAQQGIGRAAAVLLAREGADVAVNYLDDRAAAEAVAKEVEAAGRRCTLIQADMARPAEITRMVETAAADLGGLDLLVNNAAVFPRTPFLELPEEQWDFVLDINLKGPFLCSQAVARRMIALGRRGAIVSISSGAAYRGSPRGAHYTAAKAGILGLTRTMALELAPHGIRVNAIAPGLVDTAQPRYGMNEAEIAAASAQVPLGAMARPEEIAEGVVFLASNAARHITGQVLHINGGSLFG